MTQSIEKLRELSLKDLIIRGVEYVRQEKQYAVNSVISVFDERINELDHRDEEYIIGCVHLIRHNFKRIPAVQRLRMQMIYSVFEGAYVWNVEAHENSVWFLQKHVVYNDEVPLEVKLWGTMALLEAAEVYWATMASHIEAGNIPQLKEFDLREDVLVGTLESAVKQGLIYGYPKEYVDSTMTSIQNSRERIDHYRQEHGLNT